ncbi:DUF6461 domain-containing protein [Actinokineospora auranticolor]|uniref:Uncharacterized protein n=1 Tax=Actinokineospora auranticolor TaxID=155976 RepID=A0A2S6GPU2_9PSEU|nr:DUF6461 domain-containing protein [Actinokineospora auranticolor]PPK67183.1 hypothetical protein CLV40_108180 [Actinokineospora auranticolor]
MGDVDELAAAVADALPALIAVIPTKPAAELGRAGTAERPSWRSDSNQHAVTAQLHELPATVVDRLHGALELAVDHLALNAPASVAELLVPPAYTSFLTLSMGGESEARRAIQMVGGRWPGALDLIESTAAAVAAHGRVAPLLVVGDVGDETAVAAAHGAAHLAAAVAVSSAVLRGLGGGTPEIVAVALGVAVGLLRARPMPATYERAVLERTRADYLLPGSAHGRAPVRDHVIALTEGSDLVAGDFAENGLVESVDGGVVIRTGQAEGAVTTMFHVFAEAPEVSTEFWDEVVDVSWSARAGGATILADDHYGRHVDVWSGRPHRPSTTPPWPGDYRVRVCAAGRDPDPDGQHRNEHYEVSVWAEPFSAPVVHARADRLGHRLRGEPEPAPEARPEQGYLWVSESRISVGATVTVVDGLSRDEVIRAFGADPADPVTVDRMYETYTDQWLALVERDDRVVVVEDNGFQGSRPEVIRELSRAGRAASMFWNVNALTRVSLARGGELLLQGEVMELRQGGEPEVAAALAGLDFGGPRAWTAKGLLIVDRFLGTSLVPEDLERIVDADVAYLIGG